MALSATLGLDPEVSDSAAGEAKKKLEDAMGSLEFGRDTGGAIGSAVGSQVGGGGGAVIGQSIGQGLGGMSTKAGPAGAAAGMGLAALSAIATGISVLAEASPTFGKMLDMLKQMFQMALRPFGRALGQYFMPFAQKGLQMAANFNSMVSEDGLSVALGKVVVDAIKFLNKIPYLIMSTLNKLPFKIGEFLWNAWGGLFRSMGLDMLADAAFFMADTMGFIADLLSVQPKIIGNIVADLKAGLFSILRSIFDVLKAGLDPLINILKSGFGKLMDLVSMIPGVGGSRSIGNIGGGVGGITIGGVDINPFDDQNMMFDLRNKDQQLVRQFEELTSELRRMNDNNEDNGGGSGGDDFFSRGFTGT